MLNSGNLIFILVTLNVAYGGNVSLETDGRSAIIENDFVKISFSENASVYSLIRDGKDLLGTVTARTFYFDWNAGGGKFLPSNLTIVTNTSDLVHIMYFQPVGHRRLEMEYHIAVFNDTQGFYQWIKASNTGNDTIEMAEFRMVYRLSKSLNQMSNGARTGESPKDISSNPTIQDTTWQLKDGTYWSKYDFAGYIRETPWFGLYGGGVGSWVISASHEYHSGGPLKQDLLTQHDSLMCHYLTGSHFGTPIFHGQPGWSKFYGPWLLFVSAGSDEDMLVDVVQQAEIEKSLWPYTWVEDPQYPTFRVRVSGQLTGVTRAAVIFYDSVNEQFDQQTKGYLFNTETDINGYYNFTSIRPGDYAVVVYPLVGHGSDLVLIKNVTVIEKKVSAYDDVVVQIDGLQATLGNGLINITFTENSQVSALFKNGVNLVGDVHDKTFYLDWNGGKGVFKPTNVSVLDNTTDIVHIMYYQPEAPGLLRLENHFIMLKGISGVYQYVKASNPGSDTLDIAELRTVHRFKHDLMPHVSNGKTHGDTPDLTDRPLIQDTTWQLKDGTYWSKYDYCGYIRETPWFGVFGGGFGAWVVSASREYHSGGPLKQDLLVHHNSLSANYLTSSHYGTPNHQAIPGWSKFFGPWLIYINEGNSHEEILNDVAQQAEGEQDKWPYEWVSDSNYPLVRGTVQGQVHEQLNSTVLLYSSTSEQFDLQTRGYLYYATTNEFGNFTFDNIRPGYYHLVAYPLDGHSSDIVYETAFIVNEGWQDAGTLHLPVLDDILWNIGETNRRSDSFRYSDEPRNFYWHTLPPTNLTYTIGKSNEAKDWYYAQTHNGTWNIVFNDTRDDDARVLRVAMAAASGSLIFNVTTARLRVSVNGYNMGEFEYENDKAIYRDALQSGNFHAEKIVVDAAKVINGENVVSLTILDGMVMYDAISYQRLT